jgi:hypothetical protein
VGDHLPGLYYPCRHVRSNLPNSPQLQRNAFGLRIAHDDYDPELIQEAGQRRGGDGGCLSHGGTGFFAVWLLLASAYGTEMSSTYDPDTRFEAGYARRVLALPVSL